MDQSNSEPIELAELDRSQIGNEIHDAVLPLLFASSASLTGALQNLSSHLAPEQLQRIEQARDWIDEAQASARQILTGIYPPDLNPLQWTFAARDTVERCTDTSRSESGNLCEIEWNVEESADGIDRTSALVAYRITVEACRNAITHANANRIIVDINHSKDRLNIEISDDGRGFDVDQDHSGHFGLKSMNERARAVGGTLTIDSRLGGPTKITCELPTQTG